MRLAAEKGARHVDVLWLVEHVDREFDVAVYCKIEIERRFGLTVEIANYYTDFESVTTGIIPNVVLVPFFLSAEDVGSREYSRAWPGATLVNLRWEQILYKANNSLKQLRGEVARDVVRHVAWSAESRDELVAQGARSQHVLLTGNPLSSLYERPYRDAFVARTDLAGQHGLDPSRKWLFFPENYRWAFVKDNTLRKMEARGTGIAAEQLSELRAYCLDSLRTVLGWLDAAARDDGWEVIFRPRPSTNTAAMHSLVAGVLPDRAPRLHVIKDQSVREWALASDHVMSSFSTSLIEAALAGKPINTVSPSPVPELLRYDWCDLVQDLGSVDAITAALRDPAEKATYAPTADWARARFQPRGNPIVVLAEEIGRLATRYLVEAMPPVVLPLDHEPPPVPKGLFSVLTHDKDAWTPGALIRRQALFEAVLEGCDTVSAEAGETEGTAGVRLSIVICTYNRAEHLAKLLDSLVDQQSHHMDLEILVVDNRSTDQTMLVCRNRQDSMPELRYCFEPVQGLSNARNRGIAAATRPHILYIDDDATVPRHYLGIAESILSEHDPDFFGGPVYPVYGTSKPDWFHDKFETRKYADRPKLIFGRSISGGNFGARRAKLRQLGGFDPSLGMSGTTMHFMEERAVLELYRFLTPRRLQKVFYHPELFISHYTGPANLRLSYRMRRGFKTMECGVLVRVRFALASGAKRNLAGFLREQLDVLLSSGRTLVTASAQAVLSWPPRLTAPAAKALVETARALGAISGCFKLWRATDLNTPPPEGVLFVRPYNIADLSCTAEEQDAILALADEIGVRAGIIGDERRTKPIEALLRRWRFRTFRRVVILGYLPGPLMRQLQSFCDGTEVVDFNDVSAPPLLAPARMDAKGQTTCVQWLRDLSSAEAVPLAPRRHGILMIVGANVTKTLLGRSDREKLLNWFQRSGVRADCLRITGLRMAELLMHAGVRSYKTILALGVMSPQSKRELQSLVKNVEGMEVEDLEDLRCSPEVYRAVSAASRLEATSDAAPFLEALRKLAGEVEGSSLDRRYRRATARIGSR